MIRQTHNPEYSSYFSYPWAQTLYLEIHISWCRSCTYLEFIHSMYFSMPPEFMIFNSSMWHCCHHFTLYLGLTSFAIFSLHLCILFVYLDCSLHTLLIYFSLYHPSLYSIFSSAPSDVPSSFFVLFWRNLHTLLSPLVALVSHALGLSPSCISWPLAGLTYSASLHCNFLFWRSLHTLLSIFHFYCMRFDCSQAAYVDLLLHHWTYLLCQSQMHSVGAVMLPLILKHFFIRLHVCSFAASHGISSIFFSDSPFI